MVVQGSRRYRSLDGFLNFSSRLLPHFLVSLCRTILSLRMVLLVGAVRCATKENTTVRGCKGCLALMRWMQAIGRGKAARRRCSRLVAKEERGGGTVGWDALIETG
jgi:hypothetical protein